MDSCKIEGATEETSFETMYEDMQKNPYWIRFFCRPCCPAPDLDGAISMLDKLAAEVNASATLSDDEKSRIVELIEARKKWYPTSGLCRH